MSSGEADLVAMPRHDMTITATVRGDWNDYDAVIGRTGYDTVDATLYMD